MYTEEADEEAEKDESESESEEIEQSFVENNSLIQSVIYEIETEWG